MRRLRGLDIGLQGGQKSVNFALELGRLGRGDVRGSVCPLRHRGLQHREVQIFGALHRRHADRRFRPLKDGTGPVPGIAQGFARDFHYVDVCDPHILEQGCAEDYCHGVLSPRVPHGEGLGITVPACIEGHAHCRNICFPHDPEEF
ncbi:hypothetical protein SDC9_97653 [bioreactor metagenome]|uniref:Uncharacterized protein n=1 Tax=bioreactor metagenome TaxID=1076179 RepID=A0A645AD08_9ZZZZ